MTSARAFALSKANLAGPVMAQWYLDNEAKIVTAALRGEGLQFLGCLIDWIKAIAGST